MQAMVLQRNGIYATRWIWANNALRGYKASLLLLQLLDSYSLSKQVSERPKGVWWGSVHRYFDSSERHREKAIEVEESD